MVGRLLDAPSPHRAAYALADRGVRGKAIYWRAAEHLSPRASAATIAVGAARIELCLDDRGERNMAEGWYELAERRLMRTLPRRGGLVIDAGANVGLLTAEAALAVGDGGRVVAVEPSPEMVARLRRHVAALPQVEVQPVALGRERGQATLYLPARNTGAASLATHLADGADTATVPVVPLDELVPEGVEVDLLKVDVEGHEGPLFDGAERLLRSGCVRNILVEYTVYLPHWDSRPWLAALMERVGDGYTCRQVVAAAAGPFRRLRLVPFRPFEHGQVSLLISRRALASSVRRESAPARR